MLNVSQAVNISVDSIVDSLSLDQGYHLFLLKEGIVKLIEILETYPLNLGLIIFLGVIVVYKILICLCGPRKFKKSYNLK